MESIRMDGHAPRLIESRGDGASDSQSSSEGNSPLRVNLTLGESSESASSMAVGSVPETHVDLKVDEPSLARVVTPTHVDSAVVALREAARARLARLSSIRPNTVVVPVIRSEEKERPVSAPSVFSNNRLRLEAEVEEKSLSAVPDEAPVISEDSKEGFSQARVDRINARGLPDVVDFEEEKERCAICLSELDGLLKSCRRLSPTGGCVAKFHMDCLNSWAARLRVVKCPVCVRVINDASLPEYSSDYAVNLRTVSRDENKEYDRFANGLGLSDPEIGSAEFQVVARRGQNRRDQAANRQVVAAMIGAPPPSPANPVSHQIQSVRAAVGPEQKVDQIPRAEVLSAILRAIPQQARPPAEQHQYVFDHRFGIPAPPPAPPLPPIFSPPDPPALIPRLLWLWNFHPPLDDPRLVDPVPVVLPLLTDEKYNSDFSFPPSNSDDPRFGNTKPDILPCFPPEIYLTYPGAKVVTDEWSLHLTKTPWVYHEDAGRYAINVRAPQNGDVDGRLPCFPAYRCHEDRIVARFGPIFLVEPPLVGSLLTRVSRNWNREEWLVKGGYTVAQMAIQDDRQLNVKHLSELLAAFIGAQVPLWANALYDCHEYIRSDQFLDQCQDYHTQWLERKDKVRFILFVKLLANSPFSGWVCELLKTYYEYAILSHYFMLPMLAVIISFSIMQIVAGQEVGFGVFTLVLSLMCFVPLLMFAIKWNGLWNQTPNVRPANTLRILRTCSRESHLVLPEINHGSVLKTPPTFDQPCGKEKYVTSFGTVIPRGPLVVPKCCVHDIVNGLRIRILFARHVEPQQVALFVSFCKVFMERYVRGFGVWVDYTVDEWLRHLPGKRIRVLQEEYTGTMVSEKIHQSNIFVKMEAYVGKVWSDFKPRIIQCRITDFQMMVGPFFYSVSKYLFSVFGPESSLVYDNGLDAVQLGSIVSQMFMTYGVVFESDVSNWDGSIHESMKEMEMWFLENVCPRMFVHWRIIKDHWIKVWGKCRGVRFSTRFGRRSGDMWTSCFNTFLNLMITTFVVFNIQDGVVPEFRDRIKLVAKGDDNFFSCLEDRMLSWVQEYHELGMKVKIFRRTKYQDLEYCSGKFYDTFSGLKWGVKPFRTLAKFGLNLHSHSVKIHKRLLLGTAISMLPIAGHVPILGHLFRSIISSGLSKGIKAKFEYDSFTEKISSTTVHEVSPQCEDDFMSHYGYSWDEYQRLKVWAENVTLDDFPCSLEDELFERGYRVDTGESPICFTNHLGHSWVDVEYRGEFANYYDYLAPFLEEFLRCTLGWYATAIMGALEFTALAYSGERVSALFALGIHLVLHRVMMYSPLCALVLHCVYNRFFN